jgi:hypothetical protein
VGQQRKYTLCPRIRLAEIYLIYAEAVNEAYGPKGIHPGANLSAVDAINIYRQRSKMVNVNGKFTDTKENFRERIRNERAVELALKQNDGLISDVGMWHI